MRLSPLCRSRFAVAVLALGACDPTAERETRRDTVQLAVVHADCDSDSIRPATAAPAEGLWVYQDRSALHRVAALVGPAQVTTGRTQLRRRVETLESRWGGSDTIRQVSDTASVRLELVPPFASPAAIYPVGPLVLLASYEPCSPGHREPLIRYLRRDAEGQVVTDVLLHREATP
jgi:hypothetical protein